MLIADRLDQLAAFEPSSYPVISLYLNTRPGSHGRTDFDPFVRKEFTRLATALPLRSPDRLSIERDAKRIREHLVRELRPATNGMAIFACAAQDGFFVALPLDVPIERHQLYVGSQPHLYTLARLNDQYRRYAAVIADTHSARIFVFGLAKTLARHEIESPPVSKRPAENWTQARYQRHVRNAHLHHVKEVVDAIERIVREEQIEHVIFGGDEVIVPKLREQLPAYLAQKVVDVLRLDIRTPEHEILRATVEAMREQDARDDAAIVGRLFDEYRAGGLGVVGLKPTLDALANGQVDELLLTASMEEIRGEGGEEPEFFTPGELVARARQTGAEVRFIEDAGLLAGVGGVGALLRFRR
ncbi:MAG: hypothetical protein IPM24_24245 [Bryobacterales bacterium]|nr:hypothetical protein [Bryobacterales bacterium]